MTLADVLPAVAILLGAVGNPAAGQERISDIA